MTTQAEIVNKFYDALNAKGNPDLLHKILADDWVINPPLPGPGSDIEKYISVTRPFFEALPDFKITVDAVLENNETVAVRGHIDATHVGTLFGVPGTGKAIRYMTCDFHRVVNNRIVESWHIEDYLSVFIQIGAIKI